MKKHLLTVALMIVACAVGYWWGSSNSKPANTATVAPSVTSDQGNSGNQSTSDSSIAEVLKLAKEAKQKMSTSLDDYTAKFTKQVRGDDGVLGELNEIDVKIQTRMRNESDDAPMRVYLLFQKPDANKGREVMWGKDLYAGKMMVHETGLAGSFMTLPLDPTGVVAMMGQKHPIYEIGLVRLVEQLIERGEKDVDTPNMKVTMTTGYEFDGIDAELIQVQRPKPSGDEDDFKLAEIVFDRERMIILSYRSFGWPESSAADAPDAELPLLESYSYHNIQTNVGLTDEDFDIKNKAYNFP